MATRFGVDVLFYDECVPHESRQRTIEQGIGRKDPTNVGTSR